MPTPQTQRRLAPAPAPGPAPRPALSRWLGTTNDVTGIFLSAGRIPGLINLGGGLPEPSTYPAAELAEIAREAVLAHPTDCLGYGPIPGLPELRDHLAARFSTPRLRLTRENVLVTTGSVQGLDLLGKVLLEEGSTLAVQHPTYLGALDAWRPRLPAYRPMALEAPGFDPVAAMAGAQFAYVVPNFSNPTGRLVDHAMRGRLARAARHTGTWLIEDDPYGSLHYEGEPLPSVLELDAADEAGSGPYGGPVAYLGTLSKQIAPGLRVGWVIAAPALIEALALAKQAGDMCTSGLSQHIALRALEGGLVARLQPALVALYRERRDALCSALERHAAGWLAFQRPVGGMFVWADLLEPRVDATRLLPACLEAGVCVAPGAAFDAGGRPTRSLRINFTLNAPEVLEEGVRRLVAALRSVARAA